VIARELNKFAGRVAVVSGDDEPRCSEEIKESKAALEHLEKIKEKTL